MPALDAVFDRRRETYEDKFAVVVTVSLAQFVFAGYVLADIPAGAVDTQELLAHEMAEHAIKEFLYDIPEPVSGEQEVYDNCVEHLFHEYNVESIDRNYLQPYTKGWFGFRHSMRLFFRFLVTENLIDNTFDSFWTGVRSGFEHLKLRGNRLSNAKVVYGLIHDLNSPQA